MKMKKIFVFFVIFFFAVFSCLAVNNMGIQMIGSPGVDITPVSLDNMKVGESVTIDGYGIITITKVKIADHMNYYNKDSTSINRSWGGASRINAGREAMFYAIMVDIINLSHSPVNFLKDCSVIATYNDTYQFSGWAHQFNWNNGYDSRITDGGLGDDSREISKYTYINDANQFEINSMYAGHYVFGVTLPNAVIEREEPLSIVITIGGNELTYIVRK